jgi:PAP2 superfamily
MFSQQPPSPARLRFAGLVTLLLVLLKVVLVVPSPLVAQPEPVAVQTLAAAPSAQVATEWFDLYLTIVKNTNGFTPPVAARALGYAGVALYETVMPGFPGYQSLVGQLNELEALPQPDANLAYDWPTAANAALAQIARLLFANTSAQNLAAIYALEAEWQPAGLDSATQIRSVQFGYQMADAVFAWSITDGGHEGYHQNWSQTNSGGPGENNPCHWLLDTPVMNKKRYCPENKLRAAKSAPVAPGQWQPTLPAYMPPLLPSWGENRPLVLARGDACPIAAPLPYAEEPTSPFYQEALEVYTTTQTLTAEQKAVARFWADVQGQTATPAGHSVAIATQLLRQENAALIRAAETYAKVGIAVADAFIGCWHAKYQYNLVRPITYIRKLLDPAWRPLINTPPFPEYPSGHSVQSGAVAAVLTDLFGAEYAFVDQTYAARDLPPRSFASFAAMAKEASLSRLYGGIHFRGAIEQGLRQGECIGARVNALRTRR